MEITNCHTVSMVGFDVMSYVWHQFNIQPSRERVEMGQALRFLE